MRPGKKLKLRTEKRSGIDMARKGKPWYSDMAEYKPGYGMSHGKKENTIQTHGFYRPEDEESWMDVTRRETLEGAEAAVESSVEHFSKKLEYIKGPKVVKTFK